MMMKEEVMKILNEAPNARKLLLENYNNLLNVADYCYNNYTQQQSSDGSLKALEETKNLTAQSLASIAYQISTLATSVLSLLDAQTSQLRHMESSINLIGQSVEMHREKVSRREISIFTAVRRVPRGPKILPPPQPAVGSQPRPPYSRRPISYQQLDNVGHGMKLPGKQWERAGSIRKQGASIRTSKSPEAIQCPLAPPGGSSTFGKPVAPPTIPTTWQAPPEGDIITTPADDTPPPPPPPPPPPNSSEMPMALPPPPDSSEMPMAPLPPPDSSEMLMAPPPPANFSEMLMAPPPPPDCRLPVAPPLPSDCGMPVAPPLPPSEMVLPLTPPLCLETVVEESSLPPPSPPPTDDDAFHPLSNDDSELPAPPPSSQEVDDLEVTIFPPPPLLDSQAAVDASAPVEKQDSGTPPHYLEKVVALYCYDAFKPHHLSITQGDVIYLMHRHDNGWYEGILNGKQGFFPKNYVQSCD
ncbi:abl interactor 1-like isoform X3 [Dunckerocampus dactyliophorus]|uniref:abl interactor 1-like isoform X3 n=1 Tax=Dunckerocampus dactyliophorus TaxID=161453 RepID=UPI002406B1D8|nr:abl interactor 1-like isoform X3 [Dunckerocampus dactyliophorus]